MEKQKYIKPVISQHFSEGSWGEGNDLSELKQFIESCEQLNCKHFSIKVSVYDDEIEYIEFFGNLVRDETDEEYAQRMKDEAEIRERREKREREEYERLKLKFETNN